MPDLTDFHFGATVVSSEGRNVGTLKSVVVDQDGFDAHALVIKEEEPLAARLLGAESLTVRDELVVPIAAVEAASHDQIRLRITVREVRRQRPYLSYHLRPLSSEDAFGQVLALGTSTPNLPMVAVRAAVWASTTWYSTGKPVKGPPPCVQAGTLATTTWSACQPTGQRL